MKKKLPKVIFFGNEQIATGTVSLATTLKALIDSGYPICATVVNNTSNKRRDQSINKVITISEQNNIPVLNNVKNKFLLNFIQQNKPDIGVLVAYGKILSNDVINSIPYGILNIHPSLLPLHRGPTPIESSILQGDKSTGVTIIKLSEKMDAGPIISQTSIILNGNESKQQIADNLLKIGSKELAKNILLVTTGKATTYTQDEKLATYDQKILKDNGVIDPKKTPIQLAREVRAYFGWPGSRLQVRDTWITVTKASISNINVPKGHLKMLEGQLLYGCKDGSLNIKQLKPAGKKEMSASAFSNGYAHLIN